MKKNYHYNPIHDKILEYSFKQGLRLNEMLTNTEIIPPSITWLLPIKTISESNSTEHWSKKHKRHKKQQKAIWWQFVSTKPQISLPCTVYLIRLGKKLLDDDNLAISFKWIRDAIADNLIPGLAPGQADSDPRITWQYKQENAKSNGIKIIFSFPATA